MVAFLESIGLSPEIVRWLVFALICLVAGSFSRKRRWLYIPATGGLVAGLVTWTPLLEDTNAEPQVGVFLVACFVAFFFLRSRGIFSAEKESSSRKIKEKAM